MLILELLELNSNPQGGTQQAKTCSGASALLTSSYPRLESYSVPNILALVCLDHSHQLGECNWS